MPPVNTLRLMCFPRAAVKTASTLRRPTEQGTRWAGFPEWSGWFGVGESDQTLVFLLGRASVLLPLQ